MIHRLPVEAFPGMWANVYLVEVDGWLVLIDTGSGSEACNAGLEEGVSSLGRQLNEITHVLLTHGHIDHYGGLTHLQGRTKARIGVHELDAQTVTHHEARLTLMTRRLDAFLVQAGIFKENREELLGMYRFTKAFYRSVPVDLTYEAQGMQIGPFEMIHLPGHCPGHVGMKLHDALFCGDLVLEGLIPHQSPEELVPFMGVRHYLHSLSALSRWGRDSHLILNGHDDPFDGLPARIGEIRQGLSRRIYQTLVALAEPRTIAEVTTEVYGEMGGYNALLVLEKIGAYVEYLYQSNLLEITNLLELEASPQPVPVRYRRLGVVDEVEILPKESAYVFV
jgi:glyoxylase-like metal-dependent hydrolase (beta-lactamase superfamily II)